MSNPARRRSSSSRQRPWSLADVRPPRHAHLVGIAGAGMRSLARVLLDEGWTVSGSDARVDELPRLAAAGVELFQRHAAENVDPQTDLVIHSDAVPLTNPELLHAGESRLPMLSYFQAVGQLMLGRRGLAVAGTHGKSTTTAMLADALDLAGLPATVVYGAEPLAQELDGRRGEGRESAEDKEDKADKASEVDKASDHDARPALMVVEACEYRANFLNLRPESAVITGIEPDHFDCYRTTEQLTHAFALFARRLPKDGLLLIRSGCRASAVAASGVVCDVETFGLDPTADWSAEHLIERQGKYHFSIHRRGRPVGQVALRVAGRHNVLNALAAAALAWRVGAKPREITMGLSRFAGLRRRLELVGQWRGVTLLDDYAHHPTEVTATLETVRRIYPGRRLWLVFQPHQTSRTERQLDELAASLQNADRVLVADVFRAREPLDARPAVTAADLAERVRLGGVDTSGIHSMLEIGRLLRARLRSGDVLITMGAGDIRKIYHEFSERVRQGRAAS